MGRRPLTDPVGGEIRFEHDRVGNLTKTTFGDGKEQLRNPDKVGNLFESPDQKDRKYDKGGKLLESKGAHYKYDAAVTSTGTLDALLSLLLLSTSAATSGLEV